MPRPLPGTTPLNPALWLSWAHRNPNHAWANPLPLPTGMCQALGPKLSAHPASAQHVGAGTWDRCQICYRLCMPSSTSSSSVDWTPGYTLTKSSCRAFPAEPNWSDAQHTGTVPHGERLQISQVQELSTFPSNKIGPWRVPWNQWFPCTHDTETKPCTSILLRTNVPMVRILSRTQCQAGFTALWRPWTETTLQYMPPPKTVVKSWTICWGLRTRSTVYACKLPCHFPHDPSGA